VIRCQNSVLKLAESKVQKNAQKDGGLKASKTVYTSWGKRPRKVLRFSKSGLPHLEQAYSTHFVKRKESGK
jgi:hypothetical protein